MYSCAMVCLLWEVKKDLVAFMGEVLFLKGIIMFALVCKWCKYFIVITLSNSTPCQRCGEYFHDELKLYSRTTLAAC